MAVCLTLPRCWPVRRWQVGAPSSGQFGVTACPRELVVASAQDRWWPLPPLPPWRNFRAPYFALPYLTACFCGGGALVAAWRVTRHLASNAALGESRGRGASAERWYHHPVGFPDFIHDPNRPAGHGCRLLTAFSSCFAWCLGCSRSAAWRRSPRWAWAGAAGDFLVISSPPRHQPLSVSVSGPRPQP